MHIQDIHITPIAITDPPLLNAAGLHAPYALRTIIEVVTNDGISGLGEVPGRAETTAALQAAAEVLVGQDPFQRNAIYRGLVERFGAGNQPNNLTGWRRRQIVHVFSAIEVACFDIMGKATGRPVCDLLGGRARDRVDFSAYLFYKYAEHIERPYAPDPWGEALTPAQLVAQARRMIDLYGFQSIKLKAGALPPEQEAAGILALAQAFPGKPLRIDHNANWTVATSLRIVEQLRGVLEYYEDPAPGLDGMADRKSVV